MSKHDFNGPRGSTNLSGDFAKIEWNSKFDNTFNEKLNAVQHFIDSEALRYMVDYMPKDTSTLINTAIVNTVPGEGIISGGATPYARRQYYENNGNPNEPKRGKKWFERMKADKAEIILQGAALVARRSK